MKQAKRKAPKGLSQKRYTPSRTVVNYIRRRLQLADSNDSKASAARRNDNEARNILFQSITNLVYYFEMLSVHPELYDDKVKRDVEELLGLGEHLLEGQPKDSFLIAHLMELERRATRSRDIDPEGIRRVYDTARGIDSNIGRLIASTLFWKELENIDDDDAARDSRLVLLQVLQRLVTYKVLDQLMRDKAFDRLPRIIDALRNDFERIDQWITYATRDAHSHLKYSGPKKRLLPNRPPYSEQVKLFGDFEDFLDD